MNIISVRRWVAQCLIYLASFVFPGETGCFVKYLFNGWVIIDGSLIRQTPCPELRHGFKWETWTLPDEFHYDLLKMYKSYSKRKGGR